MKRKMNQILDSQKIMLERKEKNKNATNDKKMGRLFETHLNEIEAWLEGQENFKILYISYNDIVENPRKNAQMVNSFLGNILDVKEMVKIVNKSLYRQIEK